MYLLRIKGFSEKQRNLLIENMAQRGMATNVHYKPLPLLSLYKSMGYKIEDYPRSYSLYKNEISLPVYFNLSLENVQELGQALIEEVESLL